MKKFISIISFGLVICLGFMFLPSGTLNAYASKTESVQAELNVPVKSALLYDAKSGTVIYEKNGHERLPIASMTKLASLMLVFEEIEKGNISLEEKVKISKHAADTEGSSAFLDKGAEYLVSDLIMTCIVCSANDSTVALAERVAGSEQAFVAKMNEKAHDLGLKDTAFANCTGLPILDHYSSAYDISKIYAQICDNKIYKKFSKIWMTELKHPSGRKTDIVNTNRLIKSFEGCDSGKTGFTNDAGYCLSASATRGGMRLIGVVIGAHDSKTRFNEMANMFNYGFANYENKLVLSNKNALYETEVKNSLVKSVKVYPEQNFVKFLKKGEDFKYSLDYKLGNVKAPKRAHDEVGTLYVLDQNNMVVFETPLVVKEDLHAIKIKDILEKICQTM